MRPLPEPTPPPTEQPMLPIRVRFAPMRGDHVAVINPDAFEVYLRPDVTPAEAGEAILDGARQIRERFWPGDGPIASVIPIQRGASDEERTHGVG